MKRLNGKYKFNVELDDGKEITIWNKSYALAESYLKENNFKVVRLTQSPISPEDIQKYLQSECKRIKKNKTKKDSEKIIEMIQIIQELGR